MMKGCKGCGGKLTEIRGRYPGDPKREVCPTCLQERMEQIHDMSKQEWGWTWSKEKPLKEVD